MGACLRTTLAFSLCVSLLATALLIVPAASAQAQQTAPSRTLPESVSPPAQRPADVRVQAWQNRAMPEGAETLYVTLNDITVTGIDPLYQARFEELKAGLIGREVSAAELYRLAGEIEALYIRDGLVLTRVVVPPQTLMDGGILRLEVIEGFIETVDAAALPGAARAAVLAPVERLVGRRGVHLSEIERQLLLAGRVSGVSLSSAIMPGEQVGGSVLVLNADWSPVSGSFTVDNRLGDPYDNWKVDLLVSINGAAGFGERVYGYLSTASDLDIFGSAPMRQVLGAGFSLPIGRNGLVFNGDYLNARVNPEPVTGATPIRGSFDRASFGLSYPLILDRRTSLDIFGQFSALSEVQALPQFGVDLSRDRLRILSVGASGSASAGTASLISGAVRFSQGLDLFNARTLADAAVSGVPLSRQGAEPDFTKIEANATFVHLFGRGLQAKIDARGQLSASGALPASAQFSLDTIDGLPGFALGSLNVDEGLTGKIELAANRALASPGFALTPYLFAAYGYGTLAQPTIVEPGSIEGWSVGGGLRFEFADRITGSVDVARRDDTLTDQGDTRATLGVGVSF